ncbi:hypothetical protein TRAPUB_822 [Trametes pubescens]|uniref:Uncharacterized protein n=1 Tax=Trametes pubescens TaxID=154538 RepID=A0A1M2VL67_TRAPU|nr:hypothetical protein TRAPUB_822 [Trametes pubescens]
MGSDAAGLRTQSPGEPLCPGSTTPPPVPYGSRFVKPPVEQPVAAGKLHPERARLLFREPHVPVRSLGPPVRSPDRGYQDSMRRDDRALPPRPIDDARLAPPRERSPPPPQNGHRPPNAKRGGSLLDRLTLDDDPPAHDGGSLRDRVAFPAHGGSEGGASAHAESMEVDLEGDDGGKGGGGRGMGRRRSGKPKRTRRNGAS